MAWTRMETTRCTRGSVNRHLWVKCNFCGLHLEQLAHNKKLRWRVSLQENIKFWRFRHLGFAVMPWHLRRNIPHLSGNGGCWVDGNYQRGEGIRVSRKHRESCDAPKSRHEAWFSRAEWLTACEGSQEALFSYLKMGTTIPIPQG